MKKYERYKDSGVEWIGEIPEEWEVKKLKFTLNFDIGGTPSTKNMEYFNGDNIWLCISDLKGKKITKSEKMLTNKAIKFSGLNKVKKGSLLYSFKLSIGNVAFTECDLYTNEAIASFSSELNKNLSFWYYVLPSFIEKNANENIYGAKILNQFRIKNAFLINPKIKEQNKIANFLDKKIEAIEDFIKNKQKLIELLEEKKKTIITNAVTKGINLDVNYKKSGVEWIGGISEHWEVRRLATFGVFSKGSGLPKSDLVEKGVPAILYGDIYTKYNTKVIDVINHVSEKSSLSSKMIKKGDILFTGSGETKEDIGKNIVYLGGNKVYAGGDIIIFHQKKYDSLFLSYSLNSSFSIDQKIVSAKGDIIVHTYSSKLKNIYIAIPPLKEQQKIVTYIEQESKKIDDLKEKYQKEIDLIKEYKERLIYDVVTGKMNVQDYEIH